MVALQLGREGVADRLVFAHAFRFAPGGEGVDLRLGDSLFGGDRRMDVPFVLLGPGAGGDQDHELREGVADGRVEAEVVAHASGGAHQIGTAHQHCEWSEGRLASGSGEVPGRLLLDGVVGVGRNWTETGFGVGGGCS